MTCCAVICFKAFLMFLLCCKQVNAKCDGKLLKFTKIDLIRGFEKSSKNVSVSLPRQFQSVDDSFAISFKNRFSIQSIVFQGSVAAYSVSYRFASNSPEWQPIFDKFGSAKVFRSADYGISTAIDFPIVAEQLLISVLQTSGSVGVLDVKVYGCEYEETEFHLSDESQCLYYDLEQHGFIVSMYNHLTFRLKTFQSNGILLASFGNQYDLVLLLLRNGRLEAYLDFGSRVTTHLIVNLALNDGKWHRVDLVHNESDISIYIDGINFNRTTPYGANYRLDLDRQVYIGCAPLVLPVLLYLHNSANFTGSISNLTINDRKLMIPSDTSDTNSKVLPNPFGSTFLSLIDPTAWIEKQNVNVQNSMSLNISLRTFSQNATVFQMKSSGRVSDVILEILNGQIVLIVSGFGEPLLLHSSVNVADSLWHIIELDLELNNFKINVDGFDMHQINGQFLFKSSNVIKFGGNSFMGCLRDVFVNNVLQQFSVSDTHSKDDHFTWGFCGYRDFCQPNPCANGGTCLNKWSSFSCSCLPSYFGNNCQIINLPKSCAEYFAFFHKDPIISNKPNNVLLDLDGSGRLKPFKVQCILENNIVYTMVPHDQPTAVEFKGFSNRGDGQLVISYNADRLSLLKLVQDHVDCMQETIFECFGGTKLMNSPTIASGSPTWWMGFSAVHIDAWGSAEPGSRMCDCALNGTCLNGHKCNCDSGLDAVDAGNITRKEHLPVRRVFVGDTNFFGKYARITVGPLICRRNLLGESVVTFTKPTDYMLLIKEPSSDNNVIEIQFEFLTTLPKFTLLSNHPVGSFDMLNLYYSDSQMVLEVISSGSVLILNQTLTTLNEYQWHNVYIQLTNVGCSLIIDRSVSNMSFTTSSFMLPNLSSVWRLGASIEWGSVFSGAFRFVLLNGQTFDLSPLVYGGIVVGFKTKCEDRPCLNGGRCLEFFSHYECNCSLIPFGGQRCERDLSYDISGVQLGPYFVDKFFSKNLFRIGFALRTKTSTTLIRAYLDFEKRITLLSLVVSRSGSIQLTFVNDRKSYTFNDTRFIFNDGTFYDLTLKYDLGYFSLQINHYKLLKFDVDVLHVNATALWTVGDSEFFGCVSRLQIGDSYFPLKNDKYLTEFENVKPGLCATSEPIISADIPSLYVDYRPPDDTFPKLTVLSVKVADHSFIVGVIMAIICGCAILLLCCCYRCWRTRPSGEYKTHEDTLMYLTGDSSQQALVPSSRINSPRREWFI